MTQANDQIYSKPLKRKILIFFLKKNLILSYYRDVSTYFCPETPLTMSSLPCGEGNGTPLQYSCLENPIDGGAW